MDLSLILILKEKLMMGRMATFLVVVFCFVALPLTVWADSKSFTPPPEKGKVYVIVRFGGTSGIVPKDIRITIKWGGWQRSGTFNSGGGRVPKEGFVIRVDHKNNDSAQLTVNTSADGSIESIYQGGEPSQKTNRNWHYQEW